MEIDHSDSNFNINEAEAAVVPSNANESPGDTDSLSTDALLDLPSLQKFEPPSKEILDAKKSSREALGIIMEGAAEASIQSPPTIPLPARKDWNAEKKQKLFDILLKTAHFQSDLVRTDTWETRPKTYFFILRQLQTLLSDVKDTTATIDRIVHTYPANPTQVARLTKVLKYVVEHCLTPAGAAMMLDLDDLPSRRETVELSMDGIRIQGARGAKDVWKIDANEVEGGQGSFLLDVKPPLTRAHYERYGQLELEYSSMNGVYVTFLNPTKLHLSTKSTSPDDIFHPYIGHAAAVGTTTLASPESTASDFQKGVGADLSAKFGWLPGQMLSGVDAGISNHENPTIRAQNWCKSYEFGYPDDKVADAPAVSRSSGALVLVAIPDSFDVEKGKELKMDSKLFAWFLESLFNMMVNPVTTPTMLSLAAKDNYPLVLVPVQLNGTPAFTTHPCLGKAPSYSHDSLRLLLSDDRAGFRSAILKSSIQSWSEKFRDGTHLLGIEELRVNLEYETIAFNSFIRAGEKEKLRNIFRNLEEGALHILPLKVTEFRLQEVDRDAFNEFYVIVIEHARFPIPRTVTLQAAEGLKKKVVQVQFISEFGYNSETIPFVPFIEAEEGFAAIGIFITIPATETTEDYSFWLELDARGEGRYLGWNSETPAKELKQEFYERRELWSEGVKEVRRKVMGVKKHIEFGLALAVPYQIANTIQTAED